MTTTNPTSVTVVGGGLAGCEAAWTLANAGVPVTLIEMKPKKYSPAHESPYLAELVCSNSFKAKRVNSAGGMLKAEMRLFGSLLLDCAEEVEVPAGGALAVDRNKFAKLVTEKIESHPLITLEKKEITEMPKGTVIIATGPLTSDAFAKHIATLLGQGYLSFYDAAAPIVEAEGLNMEKAFYATRYDRGEADYINCPFTKEEYDTFYDALIAGETAELQEFEQQVYEGCMPVEILASRGRDTLRFGPMKPVGLSDPRTGKRPYAVVQLRKENTAGSQFNLVGFQTNLKFPEQKRVFSLIPGLENAEFSRYGVMHRNTFIDSPRLLNADFTLKSNPDIIFAGQITGVEGYMESAASGIVAAYNLIRRFKGEIPLNIPEESMLGGLTRYISNPLVENFQPMGANMGLLPPLEFRGQKHERYEILANRGIDALKVSLENRNK